MGGAAGRPSGEAEEAADAGPGGSEVPTTGDGAPSGRRRDALDTTFNVALVLKGIDGALELIGGTLLALVSPATIDHLVRRLTQHELAEDPHDYIAHHLLGLTANLHSTQTFGSLYLLTHGLVKIVIVVGLLRREHWAYYVAFVFLGAFVLYQIYRMTYAPSTWLGLLTVFDVFIIWLTWREYRRMRAKGKAAAHAGG